MRRFLVVGCGGSGGKTLAYLMDQLRSDLSKDGIDELPSGWQFVFVDVPSGVDNGPDGLGSVVAQGGTYVGMGPKGGSYPDLDMAVSQKLRSSHGLDAVGTWAPPHPNQVTTPIDVGAGQYRAIGRMILLARASEVRDALRNAYGKLVTRDTISSMSRAAHAVGSEFNPNLPPIVFVIGSMAGGSGASMALDICRLLTQVPQLNPKLISVFMASADVFDSLPSADRSGVRANALAMLGEIVSSQTGAAQRHDVALLGGLGINDGEGTPIPFARVFPVGRLMGAQQALFGDGSMNAVYRGLARGLAGLMTSEVATQQFVDFDLGNSGSKPANPRYLGWGAQPAPIPWGSYGFASLSMGRDRYAEYAAQRISRACVDRLLDGHLMEGSLASGSEQVTALLDSQWNNICARLQLPAGRLAAQQAASELGQWMITTALPGERALSTAQQVTEREFTPYVPSANDQRGPQWRALMYERSAGRRQAVAQAVDRAAYEWAFDWHQALMDRLVDLVGDAASNLGLAYAGALVDRLGSHLADFVVPHAEQVSRGASNTDIAELPTEVTGLLGAMRGPITTGDAMVAKVIKSVQDKVRTQLYTRASGLISEGLRTFVSDVLRPMRGSVADIQTVLEQARTNQLRHDGLARLETNQYTAWPSDKDTRVPERFDEANNEVLLTSSAHFAGQFVADLRASVPAEVAGPSASRAVVTQVIAGVWNTTGGVQPPRGLMETKVGWRSRAFPTDPATGSSLVPSEARFDIHVRPAELLARARMFVARPEESFDRFCSESLRDYLGGGRESELDQRHRDVATKFRETLDLAVPLISVDEQTVQILHEGKSVEYRYKFSAVPFRNLAITNDLELALTTNPNIDASSLDNLRKALTDQGNPRRIDVFGSYPLYSPLAFDSVLEPVVREWDAIAPQARQSYWTNRRARPLDASLAMSDLERQAMIAGWYIGQLVGELRLPEPPYNEPVQIFDPQERRWVAFPHPLLTPPNRFRRRYDWLPAVLESHLLAVARVQQPPVMNSLKPYLLLRELYDDSEHGPAGGIVERSAIQKLSGWLADGPTSGSPSRIASVAAATSADERRIAAKEWLTGSGGPGEVAEQFLPSTTPGTSGGAYATVSTREQAAELPYFRDLAPDIAAMTRELGALLDTAFAAYERARRKAPPRSDPAGPSGPLEGEDF